MAKNRRKIATAFRRMAGGVDARAAYAASISFYRAAGPEWAKRLG
jgi:hypothetical protein